MEKQTRKLATITATTLALISPLPMLSCMGMVSQGAAMGATVLIAASVTAIGLAYSHAKTLAPRSFAAG